MADGVPRLTAIAPDGTVVPLPLFEIVMVSTCREKFALIVASPPVRVTVVVADDGLAMVAVPPVTVQLMNAYPLDGVAEIAVAAPWFTVTVPEGDVVP